MTWILVNIEQAFVEHPVELFLNTLSCDAHRLSNLRGGQRLTGERDRAQYLPARASELEWGNQMVPIFQETGVDAKYGDHDVAEDGGFDSVMRRQGNCSLVALVSG